MKREIVDKLRCPMTHRRLMLSKERLITDDGSYEYTITEGGVPLFAEKFISADAERQMEHYQHVADKYVENLSYPHTQEYMAYLDRVFLDNVRPGDLGEVAEICCGHGELLGLASSRIELGVGVDISLAMLELANKKHMNAENYIFIQGDATQLPLGDAEFSSVFMLGGVHHVSDRKRLFTEIFRILKPGGCFYFREPLSDFLLWRWIRAVIYRISPALDSETERPLLWGETVPNLEECGFRVKVWQSCGFIGFCLFMNSDVLVFNRLFRYIPGIRRITRFSTRIDELMLKIPGLKMAGLQVVGVAEKPGSKIP